MTMDKSQGLSDKIYSLSQVGHHLARRCFSSITVASRLDLNEEARVHLKP